MRSHLNAYHFRRFVIVTDRAEHEHEHEHARAVIRLPEVPSPLHVPAAQPPSPPPRDNVRFCKERRVLLANRDIMRGEVVAETVTRERKTRLPIHDFWVYLDETRSCTTSYKGVVFKASHGYVEDINCCIQMVRTCPLL